MNNLYLGIVEDNVDPLKIGRCRVRLAGLYDSLDKEDLPWLLPISPINLDTMVKPPNIGTQVICISLDDNNHNILMLGIVFGIGESVPDTADKALENYPKNRVLKTEAPHYLEFDDTEGAERINVLHKTGTYLEMKPNGDIFVQSPSGVYKGNSTMIYLNC